MKEEKLQPKPDTPQQMHQKSAARNRQANQFFAEERELASRDVAKSAHYTYRDGFRLGLGIFVGFMAGSLVLVAVTYLFSYILRVL